MTVPPFLVATQPMHGHRWGPGLDEKWLIIPLLLVVLTVTGCRKYGDVSPVAYDYAKALYSITNRRATERLDPIQMQIEQAASNQELSGRESKWLLQIVSRARQGAWERSNADARRIMEEQVVRKSASTVTR